MAASSSGGSPGLRTPILVLGALILAIVYGVPACTAGDFFWFLPTRLDAPAEIVLYERGQARPIAPGSPAFLALEGAFQRAAEEPQSAARAGLSDVTLRALTAGDGSAVEARYARPQRIAGIHLVGRPTRLLVALSGPFSSDPYLFLGDDRGWWAEALVSPGVDLVRRAAREAAP